MQLPDEEALGRVEVVREVGGQVVVSFPDFDEEEGGRSTARSASPSHACSPKGATGRATRSRFFVRGREGPRTVWAQAGFAPVSAETAEGCLRAAVELLGRAPEPPGAEPSGS